MRRTIETLVAGSRRLAFTVFAMVLVACGADAGSDDTGGQAVASNASSSVEVLGEITAKLNGESRTWYVTREHQYGRWMSESDQRFHGEGTVILSGHVSKDTITNTADLLILKAHVRSTNAGPDVQSANITFGGADVWLGRYASEYGGEAIVTFDTINNSDGETHLKGTFSGKLPYKGNSSANPDLSNIVALDSGEFDVNLILSD
ncbi:MAG: hypothetical protein WBN07_04765 [Woeseiaceae bacterium]